MGLISKSHPHPPIKTANANSRDRRERDKLEKLPLPPVQLPFFTYGSFQPGELAFSQIEPFLDPCSPPRAARLGGSICIRDGLPLWNSEDHGPGVDGFVLNFAKGAREQAYIAAFDHSNPLKSTNGLQFR